MKIETPQAPEGFEATPMPSDMLDAYDMFDQAASPDLSDVRLHSRHFLIKAPSLKREESGLLLSPETRRNVAQDDFPKFNKDLYVYHLADSCERLHKGELVLLSPHANVLEFVVENTLFLICHEDHVIASRPQ